MTAEQISMLALTPQGRLFGVTATNQANARIMLREAIGCARFDVVRFPMTWTCGSTTRGCSRSGRR